MTTSPFVGSLLVVGLTLAGCGGDEPTSASSTTAVDSPAYGAQVASYDLAADGPQRFLVGLLGGDNGLVVGGQVALDFRFYGRDATETAELAEGELMSTDVTATFTPVAAGAASPAGQGPRLKEDDEGVGVYEATDVEFSEPGFWSVTVKADIDGQSVETSAAFEVAGCTALVVGSGAPRGARRAA